MNKKWMLLAGVIFAVWTVSGCGYTRHLELPGGMESIYVKTVKNRIPAADIIAYVPGLEMDLTNAVVTRFQRDGNLKVTIEEKADVLLDASIVKYEQEGVRFSRIETVQEFRIYLIVDLKLIDGATGEILWHEPYFSGDSDYFVTEVSSLGEEAAAQRAVERLARNIVDRVVEDW